jgi:hypothetical protein
MTDQRLSPILPFHHKVRRNKHHIKDNPESDAHKSAGAIVLSVLENERDSLSEGRKEYELS